jgi:L-lactate dehydrogenase complex protein LldG
MSARENILRKIQTGIERAALPKPFPEVAAQDNASVFAKSGLSMEETFAIEFIKLGGKFIFCENERQLLDEIHVLYDNMDWQQLLCGEPRLLRLFHQHKMEFVQLADPRDEGADACITDCEFLIARTGSVILSSRQYLGRIASVYFPIHIIVAYAAQLVPDIEDGLRGMTERYGAHLPSMINLNTGPSRTADIEKTLVVGVHGPREVYCFLVMR